MKLAKILSFVMLLTMVFSCQKEDTARPSLDTREYEDPADVTQEELWSVLEKQGFEGISKSRKSSAVSFSPVIESPGTRDQMAGKSLLVRTKNGLAMTMRTKLIPGSTYTVWWVVFNNPGECAFEPCGGPGFEDFLDPDPELALLYADGAVAGKNGVVTFTAYRKIGDQSGAINDIVLGTQNRALTETKGSQVFLVVRTHGPAIPGEVKEQITTWPGGCSDPYLIPPFPEVIPNDEGDCADIQISLHIPE